MRYSRRSYWRCWRLPGAAGHRRPVRSPKLESDITLREPKSAHSETWRTGGDNDGLLSALQHRIFAPAPFDHLQTELAVLLRATPIRLDRCSGSVPVQPLLVVNAL